MPSLLLPVLGLLLLSFLLLGSLLLLLLLLLGRRMKGMEMEGEGEDVQDGGRNRKRDKEFGRNVILFTSSIQIPLGLVPRNLKDIYCKLRQF